MPRKPTSNPTPFTSDAEYLDAEFEFLRARASRIAAEKSAAVARRLEESNAARSYRPGRVTSRESKCRSLELTAEENRLRDEIDARLAVHRADGNCQKLGIDALCDEHNLTPDERLILVAAVVPGISQRFADDVFSDFASFYGAMTVADHILLLDPASVTEWIRNRRFFRPTAPLRRAGLIVLGQPHCQSGPDTLPGREVRLSMHAFATITGDADAATELDEGGVTP